MNDEISTRFYEFGEEGGSSKIKKINTLVVNFDKDIEFLEITFPDQKFKININKIKEILKNV